MKTRAFIHRFPNSIRATLTFTMSGDEINGFQFVNCTCNWNLKMTKKRIDLISLEYCVWRDAAFRQISEEFRLGNILIITK